MFQMLKLLRALGHRVTFIPDNLARTQPYTANYKSVELKFYISLTSREVRDYLISQGSEFDVVMLSRCQFAHKYIADVRRQAPQSRIVFDTVDLHFVREAGEARVTGDPKPGAEGAGNATTGV